MFQDLYSNETRICTACLKEKPIYDFKSHGQTSDGASSRCKLCVYRKCYPSKHATHKLCAHCKTVQPIDNFLVSKTTRDNRFAACDTCRLKAQKEKYPEHYELKKKQHADDPFKYMVTRANACNQGALKRGQSDEITVFDLYDILQSQDYICAICADPLGMDFHVDHKHPVSKGGRNTTSNIQCLCPQCNMGKRNYTDEEYIAHCIKVAKRHMP